VDSRRNGETVATCYNGPSEMPVIKLTTIQHQLSDLREDFEQLLTAFQATRSLVYRLEAELRALHHLLEEHEIKRKEVHGL